MSRRHKALFVPLLLLPLVAFTPERQGIDVRSWSVKQRIDGFGFSQAFRRNELVRALTPEKQREILDLWLSRSKGAGFSILRLGIGSSPAGARTT